MKTVWTIDFETPVCKLYSLFLPMLPKKKKKREESAAARWCFKVSAKPMCRETINFVFKVMTWPYSSLDTCRGESIHFHIHILVKDLWQHA